ncbi:unnamed protein product [Rangifer tarandus platyrhynchus]|uniref:Uncharacterized protein n=2 Tax=Rangifer tarandus platyrhynchus TaxID=3082113 RepID=A0ABN8XSA3_RANTA|nr:unnamed protein product [Rangifer tarandus platyrhynchus]CAI9690974.1 unnamed protein product [Rangifer tarandus platyrhynchus]
MPHRSPALPAPTRPGSHRSLTRAHARVTQTTTGWRRASTSTPGSRHLRPRRPRGPRALGPAAPRSSECPSPPRDSPPAPTELRTRTPARPRAPPTAPRRPLVPRVPAAAAAIAAAPGPAPRSLASPAGGRALQSGRGGGASLP